VQIQINGAQREFAQSSIALSELIEKLSLAPQRIAIEVNGQIIRRADWESTDINDGDRVEIVQFVGGGNVRQQ
jgi:sulfur carrier protein